LVVPVAVDAAALDVSDEEEEDPEELILEEDVDAPQGLGAVGQLLQAAAPEVGGAFPPAAAVDPLVEEEEEDPEELVFDDGSSESNTTPSAVDSEEGSFLPISDAADFLPLPDPSCASLDSDDLPQHERPDHVDVFMPRVNLRHFDNLAYTFAHSSIHNLDQLIFQAADLGCGPDRKSPFSLHPSAPVSLSSPPHRIGRTPFPMAPSSAGNPLSSFAATMKLIIGSFLSMNPSLPSLLAATLLSSGNATLFPTPLAPLQTLMP
jgi:hypothetical protein